ncbi:CHS-like protein [Mya arenaria]|uniref:CHS-like protein n=1 Tax=Mya arenaria TaxID=6604 RepID=A0ABY7ENR8_MYAAR|nr:CHS-like protein [Mya arenaria]
MGNGISIPLPCTATNGNQLTLEPISLLFMLVYGIALVIQFVSMFFHRLGTALHIMSSTDINCMKPNTRELNAMDIAGKIALVKEMQQMDDDDDKMSVTTTSSSGFDDDSSITQAGGEIPVAAGDNLGTKFVKNFMDLANDLRKERISETSNHSHDKFGTRKGSSSTKRKSRKTIRAMTSIQQDRDAVLHKADAIETKLQKIQKRNGGAEASTGKVDSWLHLVRDVLTQSRISLNTIGEEEKRSSLPWRNRLSRATSVEGVPREETKGKGMPKRASFGGSTPLNIIADNDEEEDMLMLKSKAKNATDRHTVTIDDVAYGKVKVDLRPRSNIVTRAVNKDNDMKLNRLSEPAKTHVGASPRISEEDARANSIESESDMSEPEASDTGSNSGAPSVTFNNKPEYIENFREAGSVSVPAPDDVFIVDS